MTQRSTISRNECEISQAVLQGQMAMLDLADRKFSFTRKRLAIETGIPATTLKSYEEGTQMPLSAFVKIAAVKGFPNELLALPFEHSGKAVTDAESDETDIDDLARAAVDVLAKYVTARHPDSPGGIRIVHNEVDDIRMSAAGLRDRAGKVAA